MLKFLFPCPLLHYIKCRHLGPTLSSEKRPENVYCWQILWFFGCANLRNTYKTLWNILITCLAAIPQLLLQVAKSSGINSRPLAMPGNPGHFAAPALNGCSLAFAECLPHAPGSSKHSFLSSEAVTVTHFLLSVFRIRILTWKVRLLRQAYRLPCLSQCFTEALLDAKEREHTGKLSISHWWCRARRSCGF